MSQISQICQNFKAKIKKKKKKLLMQTVYVHCSKTLQHGDTAELGGDAQQE